jgi:uncharacterized protein (DUF2235 family)
MVQFPEGDGGKTMTDMTVSVVHAKPTKRIILLLDGTWNDQDFGRTDTNVVRIQEIIVRTLAKRDRQGRTARLDVAKVATSYGDLDGTENIVFYERGVGTGWRDRFKGGIFGIGLDDKIRNAYRFLSFHYEPGAQIFIFGFSRGSYTARSLVGFIAAAGLLRRDDCTLDNEERAWKFYRTPPRQRLPGIWSALTPFVHSREQFEISCIGVFDTVGALGIPLGKFRQFNRDEYEFHDVELSSITRRNLHAIAIDEHRRPFEATPWRKPKFKRFTSFTEQVWFAGVHSDIGGGYIPEVERKLESPQTLDDITLDWMLKRVTAHYPDFPADRDVWTATGPQWATARQHESRDGIYRLMRLTLRSIGNYPLKNIGWYRCDGCYDRHAVSMWEKVHISALVRLGEAVATDRSMGRYLPPNLIAALPVIRATYHDPSVAPRAGSEVRVVDWDGEEFEPGDADDCAAALEVVTAAERRMG